MEFELKCKNQGNSENWVEIENRLEILDTVQKPKCPKNRIRSTWPDGGAVKSASVVLVPPLTRHPILLNIKACLHDMAGRASNWTAYLEIPDV
jgi:hypothetical protein